MKEEQDRVLHMIASLEMGGSQSFVMNIYRNIDRTKIQFDFIVDHPEQMFYKNEIERLGGRVFVLPSFRLYNIKEIRKAWNSFFDEHKEYKIMHSHFRSYASVYIPIAKKHELKTIIHSHNTSNRSEMRSIAKSIFQFPLRYQADYFMACSEKAGKWLFGNRICRSDRFWLIKNAIETKQFCFNEDIRSEVRRELRVGDSFLLGFLARVTNQKNPLFVLDVFNELLKILPNALLLFVGMVICSPK